jgi:dienelactone hydrolase
MVFLFHISILISAAYSQSIAIKGDPSVGEQENLKVFNQWVKWNNPGAILVSELRSKAAEAYDLREKEFSGITTIEDWKARQATVKLQLRKIFTGVTVNAPLNAKITGVIKKDGYRIEKLYFESSPGYYVTGCLYIPGKIKGKAPAVLHLMGHDQEAFRAELYQLINANLALKGIIVLTIDPPGQGEMVQYYDTAIKSSSIGYTVIEHCYFGNQCFLAGISPAVIFVRDATRALDYLVSRKDVDPERLGVTGFSGGGTITNYISALDERIKVSVPCSWANISRKQLETKGNQDAETVLINALPQGLLFEDLLISRAPKPTLMTFVSRDQYLSVQGARDAYAQAKRIYTAFGKTELLQYTEDDSKHWLTPKIRAAIYSFFLKHFNLPDNRSEVKVDLLPVTDLTVTPTGQVSTSLGSKMVFDLNKKEIAILASRLDSSRKNNRNHISQSIQQARKLSGYSRDNYSECALFFNGKYPRDKYSVSKYAIDIQGGHPVSFLLFVPDDSINRHKAVIYLHPEGNQINANPGGEIEKLVSMGYIVAATDVLGTGETKNNAVRNLSVGYTAVLSGTSVVGIRAGDINLVASYLKSRDDVDPENIGGIAFGELCFPLIHAAAFENLLTAITLVSTPLSYHALAMERFYKIGTKSVDEQNGYDPYELDFSWGVAGALEYYDLADLLAAIAPGKVIISDPRDHLFKPASQLLTETEMAFPISVYASGKMQNNFKITGKEETSSLIRWCFEK